MATNVPTDRIRSAAKNLEQDSRRIQSNMNANTVLFKIVAEDMEKENDSEAVETLRKALLEVLDCAHRIEYQCSALTNVSQSFEAGSELTNFSTLLDESTQRYVDAAPFDPTTHQFFGQFNQAIWNIHHAGEVAPGQEQEEIVMITSQFGLRNTRCPLTCKSVIEIEKPVRSIPCHHIYEQAAVMDYVGRYIAQHPGRTGPPCAVPGCPKYLTKVNFVCDAALNFEIQELRQKERVTQVADYTEVDLEDEE